MEKLTFFWVLVPSWRIKFFKDLVIHVCNQAQFLHWHCSRYYIHRSSNLWKFSTAKNGTRICLFFLTHFNAFLKKKNGQSLPYMSHCDSRYGVHFLRHLLYCWNRFCFLKLQWRFRKYQSRSCHWDLHISGPCLGLVRPYLVSLIFG